MYVKYVHSSWYMYMHRIEDMYSYNTPYCCFGCRRCCWRCSCCCAYLNHPSKIYNCWLSPPPGYYGTWHILRLYWFAGHSGRQQFNRCILWCTVCGGLFTLSCNFTFCLSLAAHIYGVYCWREADANGKIGSPINSREK